jgi:hypothetical protein
MHLGRNKTAGCASVSRHANFRDGALPAIGSEAEGYVMVSSKELSGSMSIGP